MESERNNIEDDAFGGRRCLEVCKYDRILICGGRNFHDRGFLYGYLDFKSGSFKKTATIIQGCASGADSLAREWAINRGFKNEDYPANWDDLEHPKAIIKVNKWGKKYNYNAGFIRNQEMLDSKPDLVIAFPGGGGTQQMVKIANEAFVPVVLVSPRQPPTN